MDNDIIFGLLRDTDGAVDITVKRDGEKVVLESVPFVMETADVKSDIVNPPCLFLQNSVYAGLLNSQYDRAAI